MNFSAAFHRRLHWLNLPGALLIALLQRTPVVRVAASAANTALVSPVSQVLKAAATTLGALGAVHSMAGATTLSASTPNPASLQVGTALPGIVFGVTGAQSQAVSWTIGGSVPPGLRFSASPNTASGVTSGIVNTNGAQLLLSGTPTASGQFIVSLKAWEGANGTATSTTFAYTINVAAAANTAPTITTQPGNVTVSVGGTVILSAAAAGSPAPTFQWFKGAAAIPGATSSAYVISGATAAEAGSYTVVATNSLGSATSNPATVTVTGTNTAPTITTQPASTTTITAGMTATFTATVSGVPAPTFQWSKGGVPISGATSATLVISAATTADAGTYTLVATNSSGSTTSNAATLTVNAVVTARPVVTTQPVSLTRAVGVSAVFTVVATGSPSIQWRKNGANIPGATTASLTFSALKTSDTASYDAVLTNTSGVEFSDTAALIVTAPLTARLSNLAVRTTLSANQVLTVGLTMSGGSKAVLLRAAGPGLGALGVPGTMADPKLTLFNGLVADVSNDNWSDTTANANTVTSANVAVGAFPLPVASLDAALVRAIDGGRTMQVSGPAAGNVIVEAYDTVATNTPRLTNLSAMNFAGTGDNVLIAGFTVAGTGTKSLLIRAGGPSLGALGVGGTLVDPKLVLRDSNQAIIAENDTYAAALVPVFTSVGAFGFVPGAKDAALIVSLPPGGYTVTVSGADGGTGTAIVEVYELP